MDQSRQQLLLGAVGPDEPEQLLDLGVRAGEEGLHVDLDVAIGMVHSEGLNVADGLVCGGVCVPLRVVSADTHSQAPLSISGRMPSSFIRP